MHCSQSVNLRPSIHSIEPHQHMVVVPPANNINITQSRANTNRLYTTHGFYNISHMTSNALITLEMCKINNSAGKKVIMPLRYALESHLSLYKPTNICPKLIIGWWNIFPFQYDILIYSHTKPHLLFSCVHIIYHIKQKNILQFLNLCDVLFLFAPSNSNLYSPT